MPHFESHVKQEDAFQFHEMAKKISREIYDFLKPVKFFVYAVESLDLSHLFLNLTSTQPNLLMTSS